MPKPAKRLAKIGRPPLGRTRLVVSVLNATDRELKRLAKPLAGHVGIAIDKMVERHDGSAL